MSSETFWDGLEGSKRLNARMREVAGGAPVTTGAEAVRAALTKYGDIRRIAVITPYMPVGDAQVRRFFDDCGFEIVALKGLKCSSPAQIAHVSEMRLRDTIIELDAPAVQAIVRLGPTRSSTRPIRLAVSDPAQRRNALF